MNYLELKINEYIIFLINYIKQKKIFFEIKKIDLELLDSNKINLL